MTPHFSSGLEEKPFRKTENFQEKQRVNFPHFPQFAQVLFLHVHLAESRNAAVLEPRTRPGPDTVVRKNLSEDLRDRGRKIRSRWETIDGHLFAQA
jgi:hypothetical protein